MAREEQGKRVLLRVGFLSSLKAMRKLACFLLTVVTSAGAEVPEMFRGADLKLGQKLIAENKCVACHQQKVGGDGSAIYKPAGRINSPGFLRGMVEQCNTELNLGFFPEEVTAVAAVLNRDHYRFTK
jgi:hypothetical protein